MYIEDMHCLSQFGAGPAPLWAALICGRVGLTDAGFMSGGDRVVVGRVDLPSSGRASRAEQLAAVVVAELSHRIRPGGAKVGLVLGTNGISEWGEHDDGDEHTRIAQACGLRGPMLEVRSDCATAPACLQVAQNWFDSGRCERVVVAAASSYVTETSWRILHASGALGARSVRCATPFEPGREGTVAAEGAAALLLSAAPPAEPLARITGIGLTLNAHRLVAPPDDGIAMAQSIREALRGVGDCTQAPAAVIAHGTGTPANDLCEVVALRNVFGAELERIPITSLKRWLGHNFAASGLFNVIAGVLALRHGRLPGSGAACGDPALGSVRLPAEAVDLDADGYLLALSHGLGVINGALAMERA